MQGSQKYLETFRDLLAVSQQNTSYHLEDELCLPLYEKTNDSNVLGLSVTSSGCYPAVTERNTQCSR